MNKFILFFSFASTLLTFDFYAKDFDKKPCEPNVPSLSAYATQGNTFDYGISLFGPEQYLHFNQVKSGNKTIQADNDSFFGFDCRNTPDIILKKKGNYWVIFNADRASVFGISVIVRFYLNGELINSLTIPSLIHSNFLQNVIEVDETPSTLRVSFRSNEPEPKMTRYILEEQTPSLSVIYLSPLDD